MAGTKTYQSQGIRNLADENLERLDTLLLAKLVAAVGIKTGLGLVGRETDFVVDPELLDHIGVGQSMSRRRHGLVGLSGDMLLHLFLAHGLGFRAMQRERKVKK